MTDVNITIIGAGVVGLAVAYQLSEEFNDIYVLEKNAAFGEETSSRSSEVVHSGIYYPNDSLKTKLCVLGRELLYNFCDEYNVNYKRCGKLIIAINIEDLETLTRLKEQAINNGVTNVVQMSKDEVQTIEPNIECLGALLVKDTGVVESYAFMKELEYHSQKKGVELVYNSNVVDIKETNVGYEIVTQDVNGEAFSFTSKFVINCAGLNSDIVSQFIGASDDRIQLNYCKGEYFAVGNGKNKMINRLIYPVPNPNLSGLGVHVTIDIDKGLKLGPNVIFLEDRDLDYTVNEDHLEDFYTSAKRFLPFLERKDLYPAYSGIRPKLSKKGEPFRDFIIREETDRGFTNFYNLIGIESPGLTASLAIGLYVKELINNKQI